MHVKNKIYDSLEYTLKSNQINVIHNIIAQQNQTSRFKGIKTNQTDQ